MSRPTVLWIAACGLAVLAGAAGYGLARLQPVAAPGGAAQTAHSGPQPLYWYDPMVPAQHFDKPGKSPFMDMQLVPRYGDSGPSGAGQAGVKIDPAAVQNLGLRTAAVERGAFAETLDLSGVVDFNGRNLAIVQTRAAGFVERVYAHAPGDVVKAGAPLADLLIPAWSGAADEYLAIRKNGDPALLAAARQRLQWLGLSGPIIDQIDRSGKAPSRMTITAPIGGALQTLDVRQGMSLSAGQTLAQISDLSTVWLNAAVPEALAGRLKVGQSAHAELAAFPGETFAGKVTAILPAVQADSRTLAARIELANPAGRLRPGLYATVHVQGGTRPALFIPSEAVIQTGKRALVMRADGHGRFTPVEVKLGGESGGRTEILSGLREGENIIASGQFLIDSEASLTGVRP